MKKITSLKYLPITKMYPKTSSRLIMPKRYCLEYINIANIDRYVKKLIFFFLYKLLKSCQKIILKIVSRKYSYNKCINLHSKSLASLIGSMSFAPKYYRFVIYTTAGK